MWRARVGASGLALTLVAAGATAHAQCSKDLDCKGDRVCEDGKCAAPKPPAVAPAASDAAAPEAPPPSVPEKVGPPRVIAVETPPVPHEPVYRFRNVSLMVGGIVGMVGGTIGLAYGLGTSGSHCYLQVTDDFRAEHCERSPSYVAYGIGAGLAVAGSIAFGIGIRRVRVEPEAQVSSWIAPHGAGLSLRLAL